MRHLFSEKEKAGLLGIDESPKNLGNGEGVKGSGEFHVDGPIGAHREAGTERVDALGRADAHGHDFRGPARLLDPEGLLQCYLAEWVHRHLHVRGLHTTLQ